MRINPVRINDPFNPHKQLLRMSWNSLNLYNFSQKKLPDLSRKSVFQQRWIAKRELRAYHVPNITQRQFMDRHFTHQLPFQKLTRAEQTKLPPIQSLCFAELERRLDVIVFRSHFAKSLLQARKAISTGNVSVNGFKCLTPSWRVSDGDMITVDPNAIPTLKMPKDSSGPAEFVRQPFMTPWMFIPAYLEVDYNTCSTIFLRSPLPQPDQMEIPSPFPPSWHQLVYDWYASIRRRKTKVRAGKPIILNSQYVKLKPKFARVIRRKQQEENKIKKPVINC